VIDAQKLIEFLEPRIDPELLVSIKARLAVPKHDSIESAYMVLVRAIADIEADRDTTSRDLTMAAMEYAAHRLTPEQEVKFLSYLLL